MDPCTYPLTPGMVMLFCPCTAEHVHISADVLSSVEVLAQVVNLLPPCESCGERFWRLSASPESVRQ